MGNAWDTASKFYSLFAAGDLDAADGLFADDCSFATPPGAMSKKEHRMFAGTFRAGLPDSRMEIDHVVDAGDEAFAEGRFVGTHTGDLQSPQGSIPASGNKIE